MEGVLNRSFSMGGSSGSGTDWSCGPQFVSVNGVMMDGSSGNWRNDSMLELMLLENWILRSDAPLRYLMAYLTASMWPGEQLLLYWEMIFVNVARSVRVWQLIQLSKPTYS